MSKHPRLAVLEFMFPIDTSKSISHALACLPSTKIWEHLQKHLPQGHILSGCNVIYKTPTALCICSITMLVTVNVIWSSSVRWEQVEMELHWKCCQTSVMRAGWQKEAADSVNQENFEFVEKQFKICALRTNLKLTWFLSYLLFIFVFP